MQNSLQHAIHVSFGWTQAFKKGNAYLNQGKVISIIATVLYQRLTLFFNNFKPFLMRVIWPPFKPSVLRTSSEESFSISGVSSCSEKIQARSIGYQMVHVHLHYTCSVSRML